MRSLFTVAGSNTMPSGSTSAVQTSRTTRSTFSSELSSGPRKSRSFVARASGASHTCSISALEDEARAVRSRREPVEEAFHRVVLEQLLERSLRPARVILETSLDRGREVRDVLDGHCIASR
jgi:hypothetical protein